MGDQNRILVEYGTSGVHFGPNRLPPDDVFRAAFGAAFAIEYLKNKDKVVWVQHTKMGREDTKLTEAECVRLASESANSVAAHAAGSFYAATEGA